MSRMLEANQTRYFTTEEVARITGVTRWRVWQWIKARQLKAERVGTFWLISEEDLKKFQQRPRKVGRPPAKRS